MGNAHPPRPFTSLADDVAIAPSDEVQQPGSPRGIVAALLNDPAGGCGAVLDDCGPGPPGARLFDEQGQHDGEYSAEDQDPAERLTVDRRGVRVDDVEGEHQANDDEQNAESEGHGDS